MMINLRPTKLENLSTIIEEMDNRFPGDEMQQEILEIITRVLGRPDTEAERQTMAENKQHLQKRQDDELKAQGGQGQKEQVEMVIDSWLQRFLRGTDDLWLVFWECSIFLGVEDYLLLQTDMSLLKCVPSAQCASNESLRYKVGSPPPLKVLGFITLPYRLRYSINSSHGTWSIMVIPEVSGVWYFNLEIYQKVWGDFRRQRCHFHQLRYYLLERVVLQKICALQNSEIEVKAPSQATWYSHRDLLAKGPNLAPFGRICENETTSR